ncbi:hypothetical protein F5Y14DRAFT_448156 [Nemania sp. NC0429]|nr:hypothetical protein F5Y14DRAFT_448156 [Nemania sp. NC0429]
MVEIGKRDMINRNTLATEPFDRNCYFGAVDFSYTKNVNEPHVLAALAYIRAERYMGKTGISNQEDEEMEIRPPVQTFQLAPDMPYPIVGGLKGA